MSTVRRFPDPASAGKALADFFVSASQRAINEKNRFSVCLTGGSSPAYMYSLLSQDPYKSEIPWDKIDFFWGDERCVPDDDKQNNAKMTFDTLLSHVPVPAANIHRMNGAIDPAQAAAAYQKTLEAYFGENPGFDLIMLGMGDNAHTASLFPHTPVLTETKNWVAGLYIEEVKMSRITLTAPFINKSKIIAFLVFGKNKARTLHEVLDGDQNIEDKPVQLIKAENGTLIWFVDDAAASELNTRA